MRILHVIDTLNPAQGGPAEGIRQFAASRALQKHTLDVLCLDNEEASWLQNTPFRSIPLGPGRTGYSYHAGLVRWLRRYGPRYDAVIVNGLWQFVGLAVRLGLRGSQVPYYVYPHGMLDPYFKRAHPAKHLKKAFYWVLAERGVLRDARALCFTCEEERRLARQTFPGANYREAVVSFGATAPGGDFAAQRTTFFTAHPHLKGKRLLLFLGRVHPKKGCDLLVSALAEAGRIEPDLHLVMAGPDPVGWRARLERQAAELGVSERITWTGMLRDDLKWGAFRAADAFVLPSHQENFGLAVAESLACNTPVLITDRVNIWREIAEADAGLVGSDTQEGIQDLLLTWLRLPQSRRETMQTAAGRCFQDRFECEQAAERLLALLAQTR